MQRARLVLLLAMFPIAAVIGGVVLGQWLAMRVPVDQNAAAAAANGPVDIASLPVASGSGVPEPPQPRMDGSRGVPPRVVKSNKPIPVVSAGAAGMPVPPPGTTVSPGTAPALAGLAADPSLHISTSPYVPSATPAPGMPGGPPAPPTSGVSGWMPQADLSSTPRGGGYSQVVPVDVGDDGSPNGLQPMMTQIADAPPRQAPASTSRLPPPNANMPAWQRVLRIALDRCEAQGSNRNACVQQARTNYCEANQGWGVVPECGP